MKRCLMTTLLLAGAMLVMAGGRNNQLRDPTPDEKVLLDRIAKQTFQEVINVRTAEPDDQGVPQNNDLILSAYRAFQDKNGELNLKNHQFGEEGHCGWQYLLIKSKAVELIVDPREDQFAGKSKITSSAVADIRIVFRNTEKDNKLTPLSGTNAAGKVLFLQFRLQGRDGYATFQ